jgi:hypothetical protein
MAKRILSLDPGGTTGITVLEFDTKEVRILEATQVKGDLSGFLAWQEKFDTPIDIIVCESFTLRPGIHGANLSPTYIMGALEALYKDFDIIYQEPKLKPLCDDQRLKKMGLYRSGQPHANDATRHGIIYLRNNRHMPTLLKGWK